MDIDRMIEQFKAHHEAGDRITPRSAECLGFARLAAATLTAEEGAHSAGCARCATLRERLLAVQGADAQDMVPQDFTSERSRRWWVVAPLLSAACLVAAVWVYRSARRVDDSLRTGVMALAPDLDQALQVLATSRRVPADGPPAAIAKENQLLRAALEQLVEDVEGLVGAVRREGGPGGP